MKLFQQMLVAPAALGLMAPLAANAAELNINGVSDYSASTVEIQNISDVHPSDWAFQALTALAERNGCAAATPNASMTRYEAAALLNKCLGDVAQVTEEEGRLLTEFAPELAVIKGRVEGLESRISEFEAGQFSSTTTMSGKAAFITGYVDDDAETDTDSITMEYMYQLNMNTSFTGDDLLYTRIKAGNVGDHFVDKGQGTYLSAAKGGSGTLAVDKLWYQFPVGDNLQVWIGPRIENYYMLASAPSIYRPITKQFALGGNGSAYGSSTSPGFGAAWTQSVDDPSDARWALSANYTAKDGASSDDDEGLFGDDTRNFLLTKIEYGSPRWQVSLATSFKDGGGYDGYFHSDLAKAPKGSMNAYGLRAYWKPETTGAIPSVQVGYDTASFDDAKDGEAEDTSGWMVGFGWKDVFIDGNSAGLAIGSRQAATSVKGSTDDPSEDNSVWEAYYTFKVNDGVSVTPAVFGGEDPANGTQDVNGAVLLTEFRF